MRIRNTVSQHVNLSKKFIEKSIKLPLGPDPHKKTGSGSASNKNQDLDPHQIDADPQHCCTV
jgi:hypothetical protein